MNSFFSRPILMLISLLATTELPAFKYKFPDDVPVTCCPVMPEAASLRRMLCIFLVTLNKTPQATDSDAHWDKAIEDCFLFIDQYGCTALPGKQAHHPLKPNIY